MLSWYQHATKCYVLLSNIGNELFRKVDGSTEVDPWRASNYRGNWSKTLLLDELPIRVSGAMLLFEFSLRLIFLSTNINFIYIRLI